MKSDIKESSPVFLIFFILSYLESAPTSICCTPASANISRIVSLSSTRIILSAL